MREALESSPRTAEDGRGKERKKRLKKKKKEGKKRAVEEERG